MSISLRVKRPTLPYHPQAFFKEGEDKYLPAINFPIGPKNAYFTIQVYNGKEAESQYLALLGHYILPKGLFSYFCHQIKSAPWLALEQSF